MEEDSEIRRTLRGFSAAGAVRGRSARRRVRRRRVIWVGYVAGGGCFQGGGEKVERRTLNVGSRKSEVGSRKTEVGSRNSRALEADYPAPKYMSFYPLCK